MTTQLETNIFMDISDADSHVNVKTTDDLIACGNIDAVPLAPEEEPIPGGQWRVAPVAALSRACTTQR